MRIIQDINWFFKKNKDYWITELFKTFYTKSIENNNSFLLTTTYQVKWLNRNSLRKILDLLEKAWKIKSWKKYNKTYWKVCTYRSISNDLYMICRDIIVKLSKKSTYIELKEWMRIEKIQQFIKKMYPKTEFIIFEWKRLFRLRWVLYCLFKSKWLWLITERNNLRKTIYTIFEFNHLIMKKT